jgi:hypothetical protein
MGWIERLELEGDVVVWYRTTKPCRYSYLAMMPQGATDATPQASSLSHTPRTRSGVSIISSSFVDSVDLLQLIWRIFVNRFYLTTDSKLHAIISRIDAIISKPNTKIYATYQFFIAKIFLVSRFCCDQIATISKLL